MSQSSACKAARASNWSIILGNTDEDYEKEAEVIQTMLADRVDGLLIVPAQAGTETIKQLQESKFPFVLLGRRFDDLPTDYVVTDDAQGGFIATEHLIKLGHKQVAMINGPLRVSSAKERLRGYKKALETYGLEIDETMVSAGAMTTEDGYRITKALLDRRVHPTAVFAYSDFVAFGVMRAIREAKLNIPNDIAVVGYDDVEFSSCLETPLTTIAIPEQELAINAVRVLETRLNTSDKDPLTSVLSVKLIVRDSTIDRSQRLMKD